MLRLKLDAAVGYAELRDEVEQAIALKGEEYLRIECLRKVTNPFLESQRGYHSYYEQVGEQRVASGKYRSAIRCAVHMLPILNGIREHAIRHQRSGKVGESARLMNGPDAGKDSIAHHRRQAL